MISPDEIKKLANLARIDIAPEELESMSKEIDSILEYVGQVQEISTNKNGGVEIGQNFNVFREDKDANVGGEYSKDILENAPATERGFIKVKKIL